MLGIRVAAVVPSFCISVLHHTVRGLQRHSVARKWHARHARAWDSASAAATHGQLKALAINLSRRRNAHVHATLAQAS